MPQDEITTTFNKALEDLQPLLDSAYSGSVSLAAEYRREDPYVQQIMDNLPELPEYCGNAFHKALRHARAADEGGL